MNPLFAEGASLAEPLRRIEMTMGNAERSHIVLAVADDEVVRQEAMGELGERLSSAYRLFEFDYEDPPLPSLPRFCRTVPKEARPCIFAHGLEQLAAGDLETYGEALDLLNGHREDIRLTRCAVVLWLTSETFADIQERAPDFADWQTAGATFALPDGERMERTALGRLSIAEAEELRREAVRFEKMLRRRNLDAALKAEFEKQLERVRTRLGRIENVRFEYCQLLIDELHDHIIRGFAPQVGGRVLSLPLEKIFLPLQAVEGRPALAEYAEEDLQRQPQSEIPDELDWQQRREEMEKRYAQLRARQTAQRTLQLADLLKERRAVLLGDPGTGKTTVTRYVAWALAAEDWTHVGESVRGLLPVLVRIANYGKAYDANRDLELIDYIATQLLPRPELGRFARQQIEAGKCLVILDGLDEVTDPELRVAVTQRIQFLVAGASANRFLVTSRIVGYDRSPLTREFKHATLQELAAEDQERFVKLWHDAIRGSHHVVDGQALVEALRAKPQISRMAANPLLLTIMVLMHWRGVKLPSRRVQVYQNTTDTLIEYWSTDRVELDAEEVKQILAPIAHYILSTHVGGVIAHSDLLPRLRSGVIEQRGCDDDEAERISGELLEALSEQSGIFLERGLDSEARPVYGFLHQTFGEYMAALQLAREVLEGSFEIGHYIHRSGWHEPLLLLAGHLSLISPTHADWLLRRILDFPCSYEPVLRRNVLLAADCLADDVQVKPVLRDEALARLARLLRDDASQPRWEARQRFQQLAATRHRRAAVAAVKRVVEELGKLEAATNDYRFSSAAALVELGEAEAAGPLLEALEDSSFQPTAIWWLRLKGRPDAALDSMKGRFLEYELAFDFSECRLFRLGLSTIAELIGAESLVGLLKDLARAAEPGDDRLGLSWMALLAGEAPSSEAILSFTSAEVPPQIRAFAAKRLLATDRRDAGAVVLKELERQEISESLEASIALLEAGEEVDLQFLYDTAVLEEPQRACKVIAALARSGRMAGALAATFQLLERQPLQIWPVIESLASTTAGEVALAAAHWLALRPGFHHRMEACELLLDAGRVEGTVPLLRFLAYETHGPPSLRACERLLALGESAAAAPVLAHAAENAAPDLCYMAAQALALSNHDPDSSPPTHTQRVELKTSILAERERAQKAAREELCRAGFDALNRLESGSEAEAAMIALGRMSLRWFEAPFPTAELPAEIAGLPATEATGAVILRGVFSDMRRGDVTSATERLENLLRQADLSRPVMASGLALAGQILDQQSSHTVMRAVRSQWSSVRQQAVEVLGDFGSPIACEVVRRCLADEEDAVRGAAVLALAEIGCPDSMDEVLAAFDDESTTVRLSAALASGFLGDNRSVQPLIARLDDEAEWVRWISAKSLGDLKAVEGTQALIRKLDDPEFFVCAHAALSLERMGTSEASEALIAAAQRNDVVIPILTLLAHSAAIDGLIAALASESTSIQQRAAEALGELRIVAAVDALSAVLVGGPPQVRDAVALSLARLGAHEALQSLKSSLRSEQPSLRAACAKALGHPALEASIRDDPEVADVLLTMLEDKESSVRAAAAAGLANFRHRVAAQALSGALDDKEAEVRKAAVSALGRSQRPKWTGYLIAALGDEDDSVRSAAARALGYSRDPAVVQPLLAVANEGGETRKQALVALGRHWSSQAREALFAALKDGPQEAVVDCLRDPAAIKHLMRSLVEWTNFRPKAALALARLGAKEAVPLLVAVASRDQAYVTALLHLDPASALSVLDRFGRQLSRESWADRLRGHALWRLEDSAGAFKAFRQAIEDREDIDDLLALAHFHFERGNHRDSATLVDRILDRWGGAGLAWFTRAVLQYKSGDTANALESLNEARWDYPDLIVLDDLRFNHLWRETALAALENLLARAEQTFPQSEVAEPHPPYQRAAGEH